MKARMLTRALAVLLPLLALPAAAAEPALIAGVFSPPRPAPDFSLQGSDGKPLQLSHYRGKVVLLSFGYSSCTEVCPVTLSILAQARRQLQEAGRDVQVVYVTVDPERDDAARMHQFLASFDPAMVGGTGSAAQLASVQKDYGITVSAKLPTASGYALAHSSFVYLIDRRGSLRALMPFGHNAADYAHDLRLLLQQ
jgi:protein SCO1/2